MIGAAANAKRLAFSGQLKAPWLGWEVELVAGGGASLIQLHGQLANPAPFRQPFYRDLQLPRCETPLF